MIEFFLVLFSLFIIISLMIHVIGKIADGVFMDWTDYFKKKWRLSNFVAGETIQALGTSAPEISISIIGLYILKENPALGMATIIGSAIFQITVVIGIPILYAKKSLEIEAKGLLRTASIYGVSVVMLWFFVQNDYSLSWIELTTLSLYHIAYIIFIILKRPKKEKNNVEDSQNTKQNDKTEENKALLLKYLDIMLETIPSPKSKYGFYKKFPIGFLITLLTIGLSSYIFVYASVEFATLLGISSSLIALTILAGGSSMPELFSNIPLAKKGNIDQAIGNAFGSNTVDICMSFALISIPYTIFIGNITGKELESMIIPILFLFAYLFIVLLTFSITKFKIQKWQGWFLVLLFIIFVLVSYFLNI
jgi:K+-dependent Na+/Ca+ exchanger-like protein